MSHVVAAILLTGVVSHGAGASADAKDAKDAKEVRAQVVQIFKAAARALARLPDARGRSVLNAALTNTRYPAFQHIWTIAAAGEIGNDDAIPVLQTLLAAAASNHNEEMRSFVVVSLAGIGARGRELAIRDLQGFTSARFRRDTARDMIAKWGRQLLESADEAEREELRRAIQAVER